nr:HAD-IIB family hydrolase [uncultured Desulfobulbus sp.]
MPRLLLCTDMDRTVIPNGQQSEHPQARKALHRLCQLPGVVLAYVTGRDIELTKKAIRDYELPMPAYAITDVGTAIYAQQGGNWQESDDWQRQIGADWQGKTHRELLEALAGFKELQLQELEKQKRYKLSYYVGLENDRQALLARVEGCLSRLGVKASCIWSVDEPEHIGLLDILPQNATKLHAIQYLQNTLGYGEEEVLFAGDSGNDLPVMASPLRSVLVANADDDTQQQALQMVRAHGVEDSLYLANDATFPLGGNYAAGVLQGVAHFAPDIIAPLKLASLKTERGAR